MQHSDFPELTVRQFKIFNFIVAKIKEQGYPPSMREICEDASLASLSSATYQLNQLERMGLIRKVPGRSRAIEVLVSVDGSGSPIRPTSAQVIAHPATAQVPNGAAGPASMASTPTQCTAAAEPAPAAGAAAATGAAAAAATTPIALEQYQSTSATAAAARSFTESPEFVTTHHTTIVPLVGHIAAGVPITAEQQVEDVFPLPTTLVGDGDIFMLKVVGDSMIDAAICDGDFVVVRQQQDANNGDIVAAMLDGEATVKTFKRRDGHLWLLPQNTAFAPILGDNCTILGKVVAVLRAI